MSPQIFKHTNQNMLHSFSICSNNLSCSSFQSVSVFQFLCRPSGTVAFVEVVGDLTARLKALALDLEIAGAKIDVGINW